jgi:CBS-domain-containing membrane protein
MGTLKSEVKRSLAAQSGYVHFLNWVQHDAELLNHTTRDWMSSPAETLSPEMTLEETVRRFHRGRPGYPVTNAEGILVGYCGRTQLYSALRALMPAETPLRDFLLVDSPAAREDELLSDLLTRTHRELVEVLPVLAADGSRRVVGVLSPLDVFLHELDRGREAYKKYALNAKVGKAS